MPQEDYSLKEVRIRLVEGMTLYSGEKMTSASQAAEVMQRELSRYDREVVCIVNLNTALQPINYNIASIGTLNTSVIEIANVLKSGILSNAGAFMMLHNHPSGNPAPSEVDLQITRRLILAGQLIGIPCMDHIIIGGNGKEIHSMRENNDVVFSPDYDQVMKEGADMVAEAGQAYAGVREAAAPYQTGMGMPEEDMPFDTPFGPFEGVDMAQELHAQDQKKTQDEAKSRKKRDEISLHFGRGLCQFFTSKRGNELARIKIPNTPFETWPSFVVPAGIIHENQYGKGFWMKVPADGKTSLSISRRVTLEDGSEGWQEKRLSVDNSHLKEMVESYKKNRPARNPGNSPDQEMSRRERGR